MMIYVLPFDIWALFLLLLLVFFSSGTNITHPAAIHLMSKTRYILHRYYLGEKKKVFAEKKINKKGFCSRKSSYFYFIVWLLHLADKRGGVDGTVVVAKDSLPSPSLSNYRILEGHTLCSKILVILCASYFLLASSYNLKTQKDHIMSCNLFDHFVKQQKTSWLIILINQPLI